MSKNNLNIIFENLRADFDVEEPNSGHENRFLIKLNNQNREVITLTQPKSNFWKPFLSIAASIVLLVTVFISFNKTNEPRDLASISPEMAETQNFFTNAISAEIEKLNSELTPEFQDLVVDALFQIELLEANYNKLKQDLTVSGNDKRVISAMISNFQDRIDILNNVLNQIEELKSTKIETYENSSTL
ncbi:MAG: hypothetical protein R2785_09030 [Flavobacteriaceae bacterium]